MIDLHLLLERVGWPLIPLVALMGLASYCAISIARKFLRLKIGGEVARIWEADCLEWAASISQFIGLAGTTYGMLGALSHLKAGDPSSVKPLIGGMAHFLWSTYMGLCVAIVCSGFAYLADLVASSSLGDDRDA